MGGSCSHLINPANCNQVNASETIRTLEDIHTDILNQQGELLLKGYGDITEARAENALPTMALSNRKVPFLYKKFNSLLSYSPWIIDIVRKLRKK